MKLYQLLEVTNQDRIAYIQFKTPENHHAISDVMMIELKDAIMAAEQDGRVKIIVLKGSPVFSVGEDIEYLTRVLTYNMGQNQADAHTLAALYMAFHRSTKIIIAQIGGDAIGSGCGLATICDFSFAVPEAKFGFPEVKMGCVPAVIMPLLLRKIGETRTKELLISGEIISAEQAKAYQLINRVVPAYEIDQRVADFANSLCNENSQAAMQLMKKMVADMQDFPLKNGMEFAARMNAFSRLTEDAKRGIKATIEGEEISW